MFLTIYNFSFGMQEAAFNPVEPRQPHMFVAEERNAIAFHQFEHLSDMIFYISERSFDVGGCVASFSYPCLLLVENFFNFFRRTDNWAVN